MGTATLAAGETLSVVVNGITYSEGNVNLVLNPDDTWVLTIPAENAIAEGVYNVDVLVTDAAGNTALETTSSELVIDTTAPAGPSVAPNLQATFDTGASDVDDVTQTTDNVFDVPVGTVSAGEPVVLYADGVEIATTTVAVDGGFVANASTLTDGVYAITYTLADVAGNVSAFSPPLNVTIDTVITAPTIDDPVATDNIINSAEQSAVLVSGTAEAESTVVVTLSDGVNTDVTVQVTTDATGNYTLLSNEADTQSLDDGNVTITAVSTDLAGNVGTSLPVDVTLDTNAPAIPVVDTIISNSETPQLTGSVSLAPSDAFEVLVNGVTYANGELQVDAGGVWTLNIPVGNELPEAQYELLATVTDGAGNSSDDASTAELTIDLTAPAVPTVVSSIQNTDVPVIEGTAILEAGETLSVVVDGVTYVQGPDLVVVGDSWSVIVPVGNPINDGIYSVDASVVDAAGNSTSDVTSTELTIDTIVPTNPTVSAQTTNNTQPVIMGTATVEAGETLTVVVNGITYTEGDSNLVLNPDNTWVLTIPPANAIVEGIYNVDVLVSDAAGNTSSETTASELVIDTTPPSSPTTAPNLQTSFDTGSSVIDDVTFMTDNVFDVPLGTASPGDGVVVYANGVEIATTTVAANGSFTSTASTLLDGDYVINYTIVDDAGNISVLSPGLDITVDTVIVVPTIDAPIASDDLINATEQSALLVSGTAEAESTVMVSFSDGDSPNVTVTVITDAAGNYTLLGSEADIQSLNDGSIALTATATDLAGNTETSLPINLTLDTNSPAIPTVVSQITNNDTPQIMGTVSLDPTDIFEVVVNGITYTSGDGDLEVIVDGFWTLVVPIGNELPEAQYEVLATVTDASGNSSIDASIVELNIDLTAPAVPTVVSSVQSSNEPILEGGSSLVPGDVLSVVVDGVAYFEGTDLVIAGSDWQLTIPASSPISDGVYSVDVTVVDLAGNSSNDVTSTELIIDTDSPAIPTVTAQTTNNTQPVIMGTAIVEVGEILSVVVNGVTYIAGDGNLELNPDDTWELTIPLVNAVAEGVYNVDVLVTDAAGNTSTEATISELIVDTTTPVTPSIAPNLLAIFDTGASDDDDVTSSTDNVFDVPAGAANPGLAVVLYADGIEIATTTVDTDGSFVANASSLTHGSYAITYTVADEASNISSPSPVLNIEIDTQTIIPVIAQPIETDNIVNAVEQVDVLISGTAEANSEILLTLTDAAAGSVQQVVITDSSGVWSLAGQELDISALQNGDIDVTADAVDIAGNTDSAIPVVVTLDRGLPVITIDPIALDDVINAIEDDTDVLIAGTVADVQDGNSVSITLNGKNYTATVVAGVWSFSLPALDAQGLAVTNTLTADVNNASGNAAMQASRVITHDTTVPEITVNPIAVDNIINLIEDDNDVIISGTSIGLEDGQTVTVALNGQTYNAIVAANAWTVAMPAADALALPVTVALTADAQDAAGNAASQQNVFVIHDVISPSVAISNAVIANAANSSAYVVSGTCTASDNNVVAQIAGAAPASQAVLCNAGSEWTATFDVSALADGSDVIIIDAAQADFAGNTAIATTVLQNKNISTPSINIAVVAGDNYINAIEDDSDVLITGTAAAIEDGQTIEVNVNGVQYLGTVEGGNWSVLAPAADVQAWNTTESIAADGSNVAGTAAQTAALTVNHDTTLPTAPVVTTQVTNSASPTIVGTATLAPGDVLTVTVGGQTYTSGDGILEVFPDGVWELTVDQTLAEDVYDVTVTVTDVAGNSASETTLAELTIDTTSPIAPLIAPDLTVASDSGFSDTDDITNDANAVFSVPTGTANSGEAVEVLADGLSIGSGVVEADGSFEIATVILADDLFDITYQLTDVAGNVSANSPGLAMTLDTQIVLPMLTTPIAADDIIGATEDAAVVISGTAENGSEVTVIFSDGANPDVTATVTTTVDGIWSTIVDVSSLENGSLAVVVESTDIAGNSASSGEHNVELDTVPSTIPTVDQLATNTGTPTVTGTAVLASGDSLSIEINTKVYNAGAGALLVDPDGTWVLTVPAVDALLDGVYDVIATITDLAANTTFDTTATELLVDTVVPAMPTVNVLITSDSSPVVTGGVTLLPGEELEVTLNSVTYTVVDNELTDNGDGTWSLAVDSNDALADAVYEVVANVIDLAGNAATDNTLNELLIDTTSPAVPTVMSQISNSATPMIMGTATVLPGETLVVSVNGIDYNLGDGPLVIEPSGIWTLSIPTDEAVADATYDVAVRVTDAAGNNSVDISAQELAVDTSLPVVPTVNNVVANVGTPTLTGTSTVADGEILEVTVGGATYTEGNGQLTLAGSDWTLEIPVVNALSQGDFDVEAVVTDSAGNFSTDITVSELTIDTGLPAAPVVVAQITNSATPVINGTVNLNAGDSLTVTVNGVAYTTSNDLVITGNDWSLPIPTNASLAEGTYSVIAIVADLAGNNSADATTDELIVDLTAPTIALDVIAIDNNINATEDNSDVMISGSTVGVEVGQNVTITIDGGISLQATVNATGLWSTALPASAAQALNESVTVIADVQDLAGNAAVSATQGLEHDVGLPVVTIAALPIIGSQMLVRLNCLECVPRVKAMSSLACPTACQQINQWHVLRQVSGRQLLILVAPLKVCQ